MGCRRPISVLNLLCLPVMKRHHPDLLSRASLALRCVVRLRSKAISNPARFDVGLFRGQSGQRSEVDGGLPLRFPSEYFTAGGERGRARVGGERREREREREREGHALQRKREGREHPETLMRFKRGVPAYPFHRKQHDPTSLACLYPPPSSFPK